MPESSNKRKAEVKTLEDLLERPWCFYCEKDFDTLPILVHHQRTKHFGCQTCTRKLTTANGLSVHMAQVHKTQLTKIENALPHREDTNIEIFGMEGIPEDVMRAHIARLTNGYHAMAAEHYRRTGNPLPGSKEAKELSNKKRKTEETKEERKARIAAFKAANRAKKAGGASTENGNAASPHTEPQQDVVSEKFPLIDIFDTY